MSSNVVDGRSSFSEQRSRSMSGIRNFVETEVESDPRKRYVFKWLPKICHNDLVEGAWWFVWGSLTSALIALITLMDVLGVKMFNETNVTSLNAFSNASTWILLFVCAMFFTVGSFGYVRAFSTPPKPPLFKWRHFATDELFGSWMNFFALIPCIFYCVVYVVNEPSGSIYWAGLFLSSAFTLVAGFVVYTCYPDEDKVLDENQKPVHYIARLVKFCLCRNKFLLKHLANDWLACCWGFFWGSVIWAIGSFCFIFTAMNTRQYFIYGTSLLDAILFTFGSAYFVAGSYPQEKPFAKVGARSANADDIESPMNSMHFESSGSAQQQRDKAPQETQPGEKRFSIILQAPESSNVTSHTQGMEEVDLMSSVPYNPAVNGDTRITEHKKAMNANDFDDFKL